MAAADSEDPGINYLEWADPPKPVEPRGVPLPVHRIARERRSSARCRSLTGRCLDGAWAVKGAMVERPAWGGSSLDATPKRK
jgi:hypothetical protein